MKPRRYLFALALIAASSCSDGLSIGPQTINGRWVAVDELPGLSLHLILIAQNGTVSGTGSWTGEAILGGDVTVTGQSAGRDVVLDLTFEHLYNGVPTGTPFSKHFAGVFTSANDIQGTTTEDGAQGTLHLRRLTGP